MLDLIRYAREHRYRFRNLHDGHPVPPMRAPRSAKRSPGPAPDAWWAIIGRCGYIAVDGERLSVYVRGQGAAARLEVAGVAVTQDCDGEAGGTAPPEALERLLVVIRALRRRPASRNPPIEAGRATRFARSTAAQDTGSAHESTQHEGVVG